MFSVCDEGALQEKDEKLLSAKVSGGKGSKTFRGKREKGMKNETDVAKS